MAALYDSAKRSRRTRFDRHRYREVVQQIDASVSAARIGRFPIGATVTIDQLTDDLHPTLARLRASEPISWLPSIGGWLVTGYGGALEVLRDPVRFTVDDERFTTGRVVGPSMLSTDGEAHRAHRGPFEPLFRRASVVEMTGTIRSTAADLVEELNSGGAAELRTAYAAPLAVSVIAAFLGFHDDRTTAADVAEVDSRLLKAYRTIVDTVVGLGTGAADPDDAADAMADLGQLIEQAIGAGGPLAQLIERGGVAEEQLRSNVAVILFGAIETCEGMTANAIAHVLADRFCAERIRDRSVDVDRVVNESLRLEPAAAVVDRYATADIDLPGPTGTVSIVAGDLVEVSLAGANRDPNVFDHPDRFDPGRAGVGQHLAFARGPHVCLGLHLAKLQTAVALETLLMMLPTIRLDEANSTPSRGHIFRKPERLGAVW